MSWWLLLCLALIVFFNRYILLEPKVIIRLPWIIQQMLQYSAPCLLIAICAPIIFFQGDQLRPQMLNPYFISAGLCVILALLSQRLVLNFVSCLICFYALNYLLKY